MPQLDKENTSNTDEDKKLQKMQKRIARLNKIKKAINNVAGGIIAVGAVTGFALSGLGGLWAGSALGIACAVPAVAGSIIIHERTKHLKEKHDQLFKKHNREAYYDYVIQEAYQRANETQKEIEHEDSIEVRKAMQKNFEQQKGTADTLSEAHTLAKRHLKSDVIQRLTDLTLKTQNKYSSSVHGIVAGIGAATTLFGVAPAFNGTGLAGAGLVVTAVGAYYAAKRRKEENTANRSLALLEKYVKNNTAGKE